MTIGKYLKSIGLSVNELSEITGQSVLTLRNWFNNPKKRMLIDLIIDGIKWRNR